MKNHLALRIFLALNLLITAGALSHLRATSNEFWVLSLLLIAGAGLGIADTIINDILPSRFCWPMVEKRRHVLYLLLAGLCATAAFSRAIDGAATFLMGRLSLDAALACWCAVMDVKNRYVVPRAKGARLNDEA